MAGYIGSKASVVSSGAERKKTFAITTNTTSLTGLSYTAGQVHVFHNGVRLVDGTDYTATNGTSITLSSAAENGDEVVVISYASFQVADAYTKAEADAAFLTPTGDGSGLSGVASAAQGALADTSLQPALAGVTSVDATTVAAFESAGLGGGGGKVLQVKFVKSNTTYDFAPGGGWKQCAAYSITITPSSTSSKILVSAHGGEHTVGVNSQAITTFFRNGTNVYGSGTFGGAYAYNTASPNSRRPVSLQYLDSPATTSACTYVIHMYNWGSNYSGFNNTTYAYINLTAMEIGV